MSDFLQTHSAVISTFEYLGVIVLISLLEILVPRSPRTGATGQRWFGNISAMVLSAIFVRLLFPVIGLGFAFLCVQRGWGLLNHVALPGWLEGAATVIVWDLSVYVRHRLVHNIPFLWRLHRLHHTDDDVDFSTALRFHPLDTIWNSAFELGLIAVLGAAPMALLAFNLLSTILDFTIHANLRVPAAVDRFFRRVIVTPDIHRTHHSRKLSETNSNYGSFLSLWDRWFGTYVAGRVDGNSGLEEFSHPKHQTLPWMLAQPFLRANSGTHSATKSAV